MLPHHTCPCRCIYICHTHIHQHHYIEPRDKNSCITFRLHSHMNENRIKTLSIAYCDNVNVFVCYGQISCFKVTYKKYQTKYFFLMNETKIIKTHCYMSLGYLNAYDKHRTCFIVCSILVDKKFVL